MSKLEELINEMCPDGVEYKSLGELGSFYSGLNGKTKDDFVDGNEKFITYMNVFSNISLDVNIDSNVKINEGEKQNVVQYGDVIFTGSSETPDECGMSSVLTIKTNEKLYLNSFCFGFRFFNSETYLPEFSKYIFRSINLRKQIKKTASGVTRFNVSKKKMEKVLIPIPPLEVQQEIVRILDTFTELTTELTTELEARKKQYEYYRRQLISFDNDVSYMTIGDICELSSGGDVPKDRWNKEPSETFNIPIYSNGVDNDGLYGYTDKPRITKPCITIAGRGAGVGHVILRKEPFYPIIRLISAIPKDFINVSFLYYCIQIIDFKIPKSGIPQLTIPMISKYNVQVPSLEEQERIATMLDRFTYLYNESIQGITAEIEARKKQYEYYRDKLLTFKELKKEGV